MTPRNFVTALAMCLFVGLGVVLNLTDTTRAQGALTDAPLDAIASEMITVSSTAIGISAGVLTAGGVAADRCYVTTETQPLRWNTSGTNPTAVIGHLAPAGTALVLNGRPDLAAFRMIRTGTDATVAVTCSRRLSP